MGNFSSVGEYKLDSDVHDKVCVKSSIIAQLQTSICLTHPAQTPLRLDYLLTVLTCVDVLYSGCTSTTLQKNPYPLLLQHLPVGKIQT